MNFGPRLAVDRARVTSAGLRIRVNGFWFSPKTKRTFIAAHQAHLAGETAAGDAFARALVFLDALDERQEQFTADPVAVALAIRDDLLTTEELERAAGAGGFEIAVPSADEARAINCRREELLKLSNLFPCP